MSKIILVGCGKAKREGRHPACELYTGPLASRRIAWASRQGCPWAIVSARWGHVEPETLVDSYDLAIDDLAAVDVAAWALDLAKAILDRLPDATDRAGLRSVNCEIHAGRSYAEPLIEVYRAVGLSTSWPVEGMSQGEQIRHYGKCAPLPGSLVR